MSQAQAAALGTAELAKKFDDLANYIHAKLPGGSARTAAIQAVVTAKAAALDCLTG